MTTAPVTDDARFRLRRTDHKQTGNAFVDGGWWPRSHDLTAELTSLLAATSGAGLTTRRVLFRMDEWTPFPPRRVEVGGAAVKLGGYRNQAVSTISLVDDSGRSLDLLVIPAETSATDAAAAMDRAAHDGDAATAADILGTGSGEDRP